jgi:DNA helicase HerA-like ATPase
MLDIEDVNPEPSRLLGRVVSVTGSQAILALSDHGGEAREGEGERFAVGTLIELRTPDSRAIGIVSAVTRPIPDSSIEGMHDSRLVEVELMGELRNDGPRGERFYRGISSYPTIDDPAFAVGSGDVEKIYQGHSGAAATVGTVTQSRGTAAPVDLEKLLTHHFAFLGASGVGKSCGMVLLLQAIIDRFDDFRVFVIDPHNEYKDCFGDRTVTLTPASMNLPFWLFNFEEIVDVFFLGRPGNEAEVELLREIIPKAKNMYHANVNRTQGLRRSPDRVTLFSPDSPVPYRISDLIGIIEQRLGKLENKGDIDMLRRLRSRIETVSQDPRCAFMFGQLTVEDTMAQVLGHLFRVPHGGKPISVVELAGIPAEVVDAVVSVLCRLAFDFGLWSEGAFPILLVCEEAHRYVPAATNQGFGPTRRSISRIAKEGRKYGLYLGLATQRPSELDPTILSQCGTVFAMRLSNDSDQDIIRAAVPDAATSQLGFLPALGSREALSIGEAVTMPMRMKFANLDATCRPRSHARPIEAVATSQGPEFIAEVVRRWRASTMRTTELAEHGGGGESEVADVVRPAAQSAKPERTPEPARRNGDGADHAGATMARRRLGDNVERAPAAAIDWNALRELSRR